MQSNPEECDLTSGCLKNIIARSPLDVLQAEILARKRKNTTNNTFQFQQNKKLQTKNDPTIKKEKKSKKEKFDLTQHEYELSRQAMIRKSSLYEKLSQADQPLPEEDCPFLVDFEKKNVKNAIFSQSGDDVEFVDQLGRTRLCNRKSLQHYRGLNAPNVTEAPLQSNKTEKINPNHDISLEFCNDQYRERLRQKWADDIELINNSHDIHYEHIRFDEVRNMGSGYFSFSRDAVTRASQLKRFKDMRRETLVAQERAITERIRRNNALSERMRRVRENRGLIQPDNPQVAIKDLVNDLLNATEEIVMLRNEINSQIEEAQKMARRLDTQRKAVPSNRADRYAARVEELRAAREPEFAPFE